MTPLFQPDAALQAGIDHARRQVFAPDARVLGVLVDADIGECCWGILYGNDAIAPDGSFIAFKAVGVDSRNGYDLVQTEHGCAFVVVAYANHAEYRRLQMLKEHIAANPDYYAARVAECWDLACA